MQNDSSVPKTINEAVQRIFEAQQAKREQEQAPIREKLRTGEAEFDYFFYGAMRHDPQRHEAADNLIRLCKFLSHGPDAAEYKAERELCAKMACMLNPQNKTYWKQWAVELAGFDKDERKTLIDSVDRYFDDVQNHKVSHERTAPFYTKCIGGKEIDSLVFHEMRLRDAHGSKIKEYQETAAQKLTFTEEDTPQTMMDDIIVYARSSGQKDRCVAGHRLMQCIPQWDNPMTPVQRANVYMHIAWLAADWETFEKANAYVQENVQQDYVLAELRANIYMLTEEKSTLDGFRLAAKEAGWMVAEAELVPEKQAASKKKTNTPV